MGVECRNGYKATHDAELFRYIEGRIHVAAQRRSPTTLGISCRNNVIGPPFRVRHTALATQCDERLSITSAVLLESISTPRLHLLQVLGRDFYEVAFAPSDFTRLLRERLMALPTHSRVRPVNRKAVQTYPHAWR